MKLTRIRKLGRFMNPETGRPVNVHKGRKVGYSCDVMFFIRSGKRVFVSDRDFYSKDLWTKVDS